MVDSQDRKNTLHTLQQIIQYQFRQNSVLELALTHSSYANERADAIGHNERLEFLGDAVLEICVSEELYKRFPAAREGELTKMRSRLVSAGSLGRVARKIQLDSCLLLGKGEEQQGGRIREAILSDAFEALLGAVYQDGGFKAAQAMVQYIFATLWPQKPDMDSGKDTKSLLQEYSQKEYKARPTYQLVSSTGPEHEKEFLIQLTMPNGESFTAAGQSVKQAEKNVAALALATLYPNDDPRQ